MKRPKPNAERFLNNKSGKASKYIHPLEIIPGWLYIILLRVSTKPQGWKKNLETQLYEIHKEIIEGGGRVHFRIFQARESGQTINYNWMKVLEDVGNEARKYNASVVAATPDRILRNRYFKTNKRPYSQLQPTEKEWQEGMEAIGENVKVMTVIHPDATPSECRGLLTIWGINYKGNKGKHRHKELGPIARQMKTDNPNLSLSDIATQLDCPRHNVWRWLQEK